MPLSDIVNVVVTTQNPGVTAAGFGVINIISQNAAWTERSRVYNNINDVAADWSSTTPEYNAAAKAFNQNPSVTKLRISRANGSPVAQRWSATVVAATLAAVYKIRLADPTNTETLASYTAVAAIPWVALTVYAAGFTVTNDTGKVYVCITAGTAAGAGGPTGTAADITDGTVHWMYAAASGTVVNDVIMYNLLLAINALSYVPAITCSLQGSVGSKTLRVLANATTSWFALNVDDPNLLTMLQDHAAPTPNTLSTDLDAILNETTDWYGMITLYNSSLYVQAAAAWAETNKKLYIADSADTIIATVVESGGATDVFHVLNGLAYARSAGVFHPRAAQFMASAECGKFFPVAPGGDNWRLKTLSGVSSGWGNGQQYTSTQRNNIKAKHAGFYYQLSGVDVIGGDGRTWVDYIDVTRGIDWWTARVGERLANLMIQRNKVPFTDAGIASIEAEVRAQNDEGITAGLINPGSPPGILPPSVTVPKSGAVSSSDRKARQLNGVNTNWVLAGAINFIQVNAQVTA